jgi:hypothetical protein
LVNVFYYIIDSEVSHLVLINPIVENLFDNTEWKHHWYEHVLPKWNSLAIGSIVGLNRILLMLGFIKPQISLENVSEDILNRQVCLIFVNILKN